LKQVKTSTFEVAYEERGETEATPVILLHGFPDDVRTWDKGASARKPLLASAPAPFVRGCAALIKIIAARMKRVYRHRLSALSVPPSQPDSARLPSLPGSFYPSARRLSSADPFPTYLLHQVCSLQQSITI
jgi:hypothetical protein